jgi:hypothetical protein
MGGGSSKENKQLAKLQQNLKLVAPFECCVANPAAEQNQGAMLL